MRLDILSEIITDILKLSLGSFVLVKCLTTYRSNVINILGNCFKGSYGGSYVSRSRYNSFGSSSSSSGSWNYDTTTSSSGGYDAVQDMLDYPRDEYPLYDPYRNQLYDNCRGGWDS